MPPVGESSNVFTLRHLSESDHPAIERIGMGYRGVWARHEVVLSLTALRYDRSDLSGMLSVRGPSGQLLEARFNVAAQTTRRQVAQDLEERAPWSGWRTVLETFCRHVLRLDREGVPFEWLEEWNGESGQQYLVDPLLPLGKPTILFGPGGVMKSTLATALALAVTTGHPLLGWPPRVGRVAVLDWESDRDDWSERATAVAQGMGVTYPRGMISYRRCDRPLSRMVEPVAAWVDEHDVALLVIDSVGLAAGVGHDGGDAAETALKLFEALRPINCSKLLIDHVAGENLENATAGRSKPYGSVFKLNLCRSAWELRAEAQPGIDGTQLVLTQRKVNRGAKAMPMGMLVKHRQASIVFERCEVTAPDLAHSALSLPERIRRLLAAEGSLSLPAIASALEVSYDSVRMAVRRDEDRFVRLPERRIGLRL